MKKFLVILILSLCAIIAKAQSDTTVIYKPIQFETEQITSKTGKSYTKYYAILDKNYYESNKVSMDRYCQIKRFNGQPCVVLITSGKTRKQKIIVL